MQYMNCCCAKSGALRGAHNKMCPYVPVIQLSGVLQTKLKWAENKN